MSNIFHLAVFAGDLEETTKFYTDNLGCKTGNSEEGKWIDIDFWGNELTLHQSESSAENVRLPVDLGDVAVPHWGIHLDRDTFEKIRKRVEDNNIAYLDKPYIRFEGTEHQQETFFVEDPNGNILEIKTTEV